MTDKFTERMNDIRDDAVSSAAWLRDIAVQLRLVLGDTPIVTGLTRVTDRVATIAEEIERISRDEFNDMWDKKMAHDRAFHAAIVGTVCDIASGGDAVTSLAKNMVGVATRPENH